MLEKTIAPLVSRFRNAIETLVLSARFRRKDSPVCICVWLLMGKVQAAKRCCPPQMANTYIRFWVQWRVMRPVVQPQTLKSVSSSYTNNIIIIYNSYAHGLYKINRDVPIRNRWWSFLYFHHNNNIIYTFSSIQSVSQRSDIIYVFKKFFSRVRQHVMIHIYFLSCNKH